MKALEINNLVKNYWKVEVLKNINLWVNSWDFFALLWVNGAWKSTLIWIITDLVRKTSWEVKIFWIDIDKDFSKAKNMIWVVPQEFNLDIFSKVIDVITTQWWYHWINKEEATKRALKLLKELDLFEKKDFQVRQLSWWMKRRLMIARALIHNPKLLILDEPTAWIDINLRKSTYKFLQELNSNWTTILLTTHYLEEVEILCNSLAIIKKWEIIINSSKNDFFDNISDAKFEITLKEAPSKIPEDLEKYNVILDKNKIILTLDKSLNLNDILDILIKNNLKIDNIKNITNELEKLFETLTN